jgi:hypothetical protein
VITLWSIFLKGTIRRASPGWHDDHQSPTLGREVQRIDRQIDRQGCDRAWHDDSPLIRACGVLGHRGLKGKPTRPLGHSVISDGLLHWSLNDGAIELLISSKSAVLISDQSG